MQVSRAPDARTVMARAGEENFRVAPRLLPPSIRADLLAVYGFARLVDQIGDEGGSDAPVLLDWAESELAATYEGSPTHPAFSRLTATVRRRRIPPDPFLRLIRANRQDQEVSSYETFQDLLSYCELSANPVGHLVLHILGAATPDRLPLSDCICTGLQLMEHWQDVAEDLRRGRVYLPREDLRRFAVEPEQLARPTATPGVRRLLAFEVARARTFLDRGAALARTLPLGGRLAVVGFVAGGRAAGDAIARARYDTLRSTPRAGIALRAWWFGRSLMQRPR